MLAVQYLTIECLRWRREGIRDTMQRQYHNVEDMYQKWTKSVGRVQDVIRGVFAENIRSNEKLRARSLGYFSEKDAQMWTTGELDAFQRLVNGLPRGTYDSILNDLDAALPSLDVPSKNNADGVFVSAV